MRKMLLAMTLALSAFNVSADNQTNQFDDLVFPPAQAPVGNPPAVYGASPYGVPYGNNLPYNMSSYPQNYNQGNGQATSEPNNSTNNQPRKPRKPWGDVRHIWPDFYTEHTNDMWDRMINAPHDMGYMPGGWRFPSLSTPDPVTVGDAVANQVPPIVEEVPNFMNFTN